MTDGDVPMILRNLTPHDLVLYSADESTVLGVLPKEQADQPRVDSGFTPDGAVPCDGVDWPLMRATHGSVLNLPDRAAGVLLVVSQLVCLSRPDRADLVFPGQLVRDERDRIIGCRSLARAGTRHA